MADAKQMNFQIRPETRERIRELARITYRGYGDTLDWLVAEAWDRMKKVEQDIPAKEESLAKEG